MAMGKRQTQRQQELWIPAADIPKAPGHPFYRKLNALLAEHGFDPFAEGLCQKFYHEELGRPGVPPGGYFRMLLIGYFEGIDATTLEANAAMRSIVRRETGESRKAFLTQLARISGIATPRREDLVRIDKSRKNKASNDDWTSPNDSDAKIAKMKDGRTHMAHKAEHAVDMDTQAIVAAGGAASRPGRYGEPLEDDGGIGREPARGDG